MFYKRVGIGIISAAFALTLSQPGVVAQSRLQTPEGRQTVAPSDMPQQPTLSEEFGKKSKVDLKAVPPSVGIDQPGVPAIQHPPVPAEESRHRVPPGTVTGTGAAVPQIGPTVPGVRPSTGEIVYPEGIPSSVRIGALEPTPFWQRAVLGAALLLQFFVLCIVGFAVYRGKVVHDDRFQGGKIIDEDYRERGLRERTSQL
jgi:hypothetical protein